MSSNDFGALFYMFIDAKSKELSTDQLYDICVIGAGAAGVSIAREFLDTNIQICVLEGGGFAYDEESQRLYEGEIIGHQYASLDSARLRFYGGTINHWGGYCSPLEDYSFQAVPWIAFSGWPIKRQDLSPYYERAARLLGLTSTSWDSSSGWQIERLMEIFGAPSLFSDSDRFVDRAYMINPARIGEVYRPALDKADNIDIFLNVNAVEIVANDAASRVIGVRCKTPKETEHIFKARHYVLATGGIENARLLLSSNAVQKEGLGNGNDLSWTLFYRSCSHQCWQAQAFRPEHQCETL